MLNRSWQELFHLISRLHTHTHFPARIFDLMSETWDLFNCRGSWILFLPFTGSSHKRSVEGSSWDWESLRNRKAVLGNGSKFTSLSDLRVVKTFLGSWIHFKMACIHSCIQNLISEMDFCPVTVMKTFDLYCLKVLAQGPLCCSDHSLHRYCNVCHSLKHVFSLCSCMLSLIT